MYLKLYLSISNFLYECCVNSNFWYWKCSHKVQKWPIRLPMMGTWRGCIIGMKSSFPIFFHLLTMITNLSFCSMIKPDLIQPSKFSSGLSYISNIAKRTHFGRNRQSSLHWAKSATKSISSLSDLTQDLKGHSPSKT